MSERATFAALGFESTHDALAAETVLREHDIAVMPIPTPKALGALCGIALRILPESVSSAEDALAEAAIPVTGRVSFEDYL